MTKQDTFSAAHWVGELALTPHPEGGYYKEVYRSENAIPATALPPEYNGSRSFSTAIYYLLERDDFSAFHRIRQDEVWHHYAGGNLELHIISPAGLYSCITLGKKGSAVPVVVIPGGHWFAATPSHGSIYALCGCTVAPGFDFADFDMPESHTLKEQFPQHAAILEKWTR
ncbi:MAG: cupin domain-containing protein [Spartobacteria bacterium]|nr:cupin domain-containing protein [Spartobacteria bacterium]